jgi:hypothetical protein
MLIDELQDYNQFHRIPGAKCGSVDPQHCGPADSVVLE